MCDACVRFRLTRVPAEICTVSTRPGPLANPSLRRNRTVCGRSPWPCRSLRRSRNTVRMLCRPWSPRTLPCHMVDSSRTDNRPERNLLCSGKNEKKRPNPKTTSINK